MRQFNFETNIEKRLSDGGKVFYVERMTSDYAERYPFNVDEFIESIFQKYQQMAAEDSRLAVWAKTREELHQQWVKTLSVMRPSGDASIYPNRDGRQEPALMEVWHKAGDYWRRGLRIGDRLPQIVPPHKITRLLDGGWICLFPKETHLLTDEPEPDLTEEQEATDSNATAAYHNGATPEPPSVVLADKPEPDLTEEQEATDPNATEAYHSGATPEPPSVGMMTETPTLSRRQQRREERERQRRNYEERMEREALETEMAEREEQKRKIFAALGAAVIVGLMIYFFGLLGPAVFGLLCGGLLKG